MLIFGLDLAAKPTNPSGFTVFGDNRIIEILLLFDDLEIIKRLGTESDSVISIDAPLSKPSDNNRLCDRLMKRYGAMPLKLKSMRDLAYRAINLKEKLEKSLGNNVEIIEVFPTGTAKILKIYDRNLHNYWLNLIAIIDAFQIQTKITETPPDTKHEIDSVLAALTGWLHTSGLTQHVGDLKGTIVIPDNKRISARFPQLLGKIEDV
jgi:predicted nuclease with RNAse H fold